MRLDHLLSKETEGKRNLAGRFKDLSSDEYEEVRKASSLDVLLVITLSKLTVE